jgi:hypothetical protein
VKLARIERVAHRSASLADAVIAGHHHEGPPGQAESIHGKTAPLRRRARACRGPEHFKLKTFHHRSHPDTSCATIVR